jgi:prepilin-type N-terminal cleavage/methylation domain-containing protein
VLRNQSKQQKKAFTLIELLIVIAIIAILTIVVIVTLNPAELLRQGRDNNRLSDLAIMNAAISVAASDNSVSIGSASTTYLSIPDPLATSTAGDQCQGISGLPTNPPGWIYHCVAPSNVKKIDGTGWIPINFNALTKVGTPIANLPIDPINQAGSYQYYTYVTSNNNFAFSVSLESSKNYPLENNNLGLDPARAAAGTNLALLAQSEGLNGWWPLDSGIGTMTPDMSGNGNNGTWLGTPAGSGGSYYVTGKVGTGAGYFNGSNDYISVGNILNQTSYTKTAWIYITNINNANNFLSGGGSDDAFWAEVGGYLDAGHNGAYRRVTDPTPLIANTWYFVGVTYDGSNLLLYKNGVLVASASGVANPTSPSLYIGSFTPPYNLMIGDIDEARVYSSAFSAGQMLATYNAQK